MPGHALAMQADKPFRSLQQVCEISVPEKRGRTSVFVVVVVVVAIFVIDEDSVPRACLCGRTETRVTLLCATTTAVLTLDLLFC